MHALVYTGTEKIVYREEKDPTKKPGETLVKVHACLLYTSPSPRDGLLSRMPSSA